MDLEPAAADKAAVHLAALVGLSVAKHLLLEVAGRFARRRQVPVSHVTRLVVYPVKSTKGIDVHEADCDYTGLIGRTNGDLSGNNLRLQDRSVLPHFAVDYR
jgi:MOSC N-terminal beta barrel domain